MNKKSKIVFYVFFSLSVVLSVELFYLQFMMYDGKIEEKKFEFVSVTSLADLAIYTDDYATRHRSLSNVFEIYSDDGALREYVNSSYSISHSHIHNTESFNHDK